MDDRRREQTTARLRLAEGLHQCQFIAATAAAAGITRGGATCNCSGASPDSSRCTRSAKAPGAASEGQVRPLHLPEFLGHAGGAVDHGVDDDRQQERPVVGHEVRAIDGEFPLQPESALFADLRDGRDDRHEQRAFLDLPADRRIPCVTPTKRTLVEPDIETHRAQRVAEAPRAAFASCDA